MGRESFTSGPQTRSTFSSVSRDQDDNTDDEKDDDVTPRPCVHVVDDDAQHELDVNDDDEDEDQDDNDADFQWSTSTSSISIPTVRRSKRQRISRSSSDYINIDDIDIG